MNYEAFFKEGKEISFLLKEHRGGKMNADPCTKDQGRS